MGASQNQKTLYEILQVEPGAFDEEIRRQYRSMVGRYHPDKHQNNDLKELAVEKLTELNNAYEVLSDRNRRAVYDRELRTGGRRAIPRPDATDFRNAPPRHLRPIVGLLTMAGIGLALRFLRNPRVFAVVALSVGLLWFLSKRNGTGKGS